MSEAPGRLAALRQSAAFRAGLPLLLVVVAGVVLATRDQWLWIFEDGSVQSDGVSAPELPTDDGELLFRIGEGSSVTYEVEERLAGRTTTASGTTTLVAGDIALDPADPAAARIGTVVVNVEAFASDSSLRDKRIRHDYLESTHFPYATFEPTAIDGLPDALVDGVDHDVTITGDLTVKETTATETFAGTVRIDGDTITADVGTDVLMSSYDVGPIAISGLVSTGDDVRLSFRLVAARTDPQTVRPDIEREVAGPDDRTDPGISEVSFARDVQPILETGCVSCHSDGGIGESTFVLSTAWEASEVAPDLALVTGARYMPPWPASSESVPFEHDWSLTDDQIATIRAWADAGGLLDVPADTTLDPVPIDVVPVERDHVIPGEGYVGTPEYRDDYRCQIYEVPDTGDDRVQWLRSFTFEPDKAEVVHHAVISLAGADSRASADALDAADPGAGWRCFFGGSSMESRQIAAWAPGQQPVEYPPGTGIPVGPGDFFVVQTHYHYDHDFPEDRSALVVDMASPDEVAAAGGALRTVAYATYLAPAEIPCTPDEIGPLCDRATVLAELAAEYGPAEAVLPDALLGACGVDLAGELADTDGVADSSCDHRVRNDGTVVGIFGHMHEFGASFRMTVNPGTPEERILLDIPTWSFDWQFDYRPSEEIVLDRGDVLRIECTWDRALSPMPEPRHITWSLGTADEMCYSAVATVSE